MVERMSRLITMLCRGADLGTMSSKDGAGATLQADESNLLLADDCQMVSESLQRYLSRPVIMHLFGEEPLAYVEIQVPADADTAQEIAVDDAMARWRIAQDPADIAERYGRTIAAAKVTTSAENDTAIEGDPMPALAGLLRQAIAGPARTKLYAAIRELLTDPEGDDDALVEGLEQLRARLPEFLDVDADAELAFERFAAAATLQGWGDAGGDSVAAENARWNERHPQGTPRSGPVAGGRFAPGKGTSREAKTKPASDQFGPLPAKHVPLTPDQNAARARLAIQFAMSGGGRVAGRAVIRDELGGVDFPYGVPGSPEKQYSDGYGLSHIDAKHPGALNRLPDVISRGDVYEHDVEPDKKRYVILGNEIAIVKRKGGGRAAGWIATSYEENPKKVALYKEAKRVTSRF